MDTLHGLLDDLVEAGPECFADCESIEALHRELARLEAFTTEATAAFDAQGDWAADGAKTSAAWISKQCRVARSAARRRVRLGKMLRHLPACTEAWHNGDIGVDQARAIVALRQPRTEVALERDEELLVSQAKKMGFEDFFRATCYWKQLADPEGADRDDMEKRAERNVFLEASFDGMWMGQMTLDPISGTIAHNELKRLEKVLFNADWAEAKERLGRDPLIDELSRTSGQRRADALVEMATRSRMAPADGQRPSPLFTVLVGFETLHGRICEIENGIVLSPSSLLPWMDGAYFERALMTLGTRIDVSVKSRFFTGSTRRAIELRDRMCTHPYCYEPAEDCQGDHIEPYSKGGPTTQENGRMLCGFHNRLRNQREHPPPLRM